jgi:hypothetical protein
MATSIRIVKCWPRQIEECGQRVYRFMDCYNKEMTDETFCPGSIYSSSTWHGVCYRQRELSHRFGHRRSPGGPASKIGDLSSYRSIVVDTASMVDKGNLCGPKARIKDLEISWDEAEPSTKPRVPGEWHVIDKAIDRALSALRSKTPDAASCKQTLANLLATMDEASGTG